MYSLNQYTTEFFASHLVQDRDLRQPLRALITNASESESITTYNVRENPLTYRFKLARYGFVEHRQEFLNLHTAPPPLLSKDKSYPDTLSWKEEDKWKLMFICSTFGSQSIIKNNYQQFGLFICICIGKTKFFRNGLINKIYFKVRLR